MIAVISPAKTLDFETECQFDATSPRFQSEARELIDVLRTKTTQDIRSLMSVSENIAELNVERYNRFASRHTKKNSKACAFAFKGDVYIGLEADDFSTQDVDFAQNHLRILSGLYGLLRPLDRIQPYRLEMGTRLAFDDYKTLYNFWENKIVDRLNLDLRAQGDNTVVNLASNEYFKSVNLKRLKGKVVDVEFKDFSNGEYKVVSFFAKKARGMMSRYIIKNQLNDVESLKGFDYEGYQFDVSTSNDFKLAFKRG
ncbi:MAG: peroxide stress protein YaaA [Bacteroidota bacterium]